jgi:hypothetical protein
MASNSTSKSLTDAVYNAITNIHFPPESSKKKLWRLMIKPPIREISEKDKKSLEKGDCIKLETIKDYPNMFYYYYKHVEKYVIIEITQLSDGTFVYCYKYD